MLLACTLTGVDAFSDLPALVDLAAEYPLVEYGILLSKTMPGQENRYPHLPELEEIAETLRAGGARLALHICGKAVGEFVAGGTFVRDLVPAFDRVQLNFAADRVHFSMLELDQAIDSVGIPVITQANRANARVADTLTSSNHQVLFDTSGGLGIRSDAWPTAIAGKTCGFAGGIGPVTIDADLVAADTASGGADHWVDMESKLRVDDRFDAGLCRRVLESVARNQAAPTKDLVG